MKAINIIRITYIMLWISLCFQNISAQDTVTIHLTGYQNGQIAWENSTDSINWYIIPGETDDSLQAIVCQTTWFRAVITDGTCDPLITDTTKVILQIQILACPGMPIVTDFDGNIYNTVLIGSQCWMKENLATTHYSDGTALVDGISAGSTVGNYTTKYWFVYNNNLSNKATYGLLYTWAGVMNGLPSSGSNPSGVQGVCPIGWHVPSDAEWKQLEMFLGMTQAQADADGWRGTTEGGKSKEAGTSHWTSPNAGADNSSGFTVLPGGYREYDGAFVTIGSWGYWWTATDYSASDALYRDLYYDSAQVYRKWRYKSYGFSVRCSRDF